MAVILPVAIGKSRTKFHVVKIDMTPMVDLGFLLITFFIFTTSLSTPAVTKLIMPKQGPPEPVPEKTLLTALIDKEKVFVYEGAFEKAVAAGSVVLTGYHAQTGLGFYIRQKQKLLEAGHHKDKLMVAIKPLQTASYQDVMNALDEMLINNVQRYGIINVTDEEAQFLAKRSK